MPRKRAAKPRPKLEKELERTTNIVRLEQGRRLVKNLKTAGRVKKFFAGRAASFLVKSLKTSPKPIHLTGTQLKAIRKEFTEKEAGNMKLDVELFAGNKKRAKAAKNMEALAERIAQVRKAIEAKLARHKKERERNPEKASLYELMFLTRFKRRISALEQEILRVSGEIHKRKRSR